MATLPNVNIDVVPAESPTQTDPFPALDPINTFDLVGPTAANRSPNALKQRDFTLRDRVNLLVANMNEVSTGDADSGVLFLPRDGTNPMTGDLNMGGKQFMNYGVLLASPTGTPNDYVQVSAGTYQKADGKGHVVYAGGSVQIITPVGGGQTRYDLVHLNDSGTLAVTQGVVGTPGVVPDFLDDELTIAVVKVDETGTIVVNDSDITDVRPFLAADQNARTLQARPVDAATPTTADALVWDGAKWSPGGAPGLKAKVEISGDATLSTVTVGEAGADFTTIATAIAYINGLTHSKDRQWAILLFENRSVGEWSNVEFTVPSWTHFIGVGKPRITTMTTSGAGIVLSEGSSLRNIVYETYQTGWSHMVSISADDVTIEDVDLRAESVSVDTGYAVGIRSGSRIKVKNLRLFPRSADQTKGCRGISFGSVGNVTDVVVENCYLKGDQNLFHREANAIEQLQVSNLRMEATTTTGSFAFGSLSSLTSASFCSVHGVCVAGPATGWEILGTQSVLVTDLMLEVAASDDMVLLSIDDLTLQGFELRNGRVSTAGGERITGGVVYYPYNDTNPALDLDVGVHVSACKIDRGSQDAPGIEAKGATSDSCVITGCTVVNTGTAPSIKGVSGADYWLIRGCVTDNSPNPNGGVGWGIACEDGDVRKGTTTNRSEDATPSDDPELKFYVKSGKKYDFEFVVFFTTLAGGIKLQINGPGTPTDLLTHLELLPTGDPTDVNAQFTIGGGYSTPISVTASIALGVAYIKGSVEEDASGVIALQWSQNASDVAVTQVTKGSYVRFREVP